MNKPILKPIKAKEVQTRHQIDLVDMNKWKVWYGKATYRYILTVQDVFSRYVWLKPLKGKSSSEIANHLKSIYSEHGPPKIIQHDQGKEFHGAVRKLMQSLKVKIIQSAPYHPQSQGKVERMHRSLRKKMLYDLLNQEREGVNWVSHLPVYARVLNEDPKKTLHWASPFEVYYGRKSNNVMQPLDCDLSEVERETHPGDFSSTLPTRRQRQSFDQRRSMIRQRARQATRNADHVESFISSGMTVKLDPLPDGNCQFAAMAD